ncbi:alpha/beta hydrolase fold domain-containing protein [Flavobacterium sp. Sd200]|uniref:alpha/beta hydrolase n=1 Tax=Flavobacterium sp. Sd200 TaxID=2692211 RepID=UPI00136F60AD|nr:alpha/beta hydrolase [Flavobacterium sp. Sd200]MXN90357.1 alpha/beta hydrolase fold domain-containing protein [Flavobacterium sp. Sd200]
MKTTVYFLKTVTLSAILLAGISCKRSAEVTLSSKGIETSTDSITVADYATDPNIERGSREFLKILNSGGTPLEKLSKEDARAVLVNAQASVNVDYSGVTESEKTITEDGLTVKLNIVRPANAQGKLPVFMFVHGGGWILGDYPTHKRLVHDLVVLSGYVAVFVNYTPSPEVRYPVAVNEIYAATKWVAKNGNEINVDGSRLGIVGNSAGGNMAAATALIAKEKNGPAIKFVDLLWPVADASFTTESYQKFATDRFLTASVMKWMFDQYTTNAADRKDYHISLVNATQEQLKGFPTTLIQVAENDILRDEGETFGRHLDEAGVNVTTVRYNGTIHDFGLLNALATQPSTRTMLQNAAAALKQNL